MSRDGTGLTYKVKLCIHCKTRTSSRGLMAEKPWTITLASSEPQSFSMMHSHSEKASGDTL